MAVGNHAEIAQLPRIESIAGVEHAKMAAFDFSSMLAALLIRIFVPRPRARNNTSI